MALHWLFPTPVLQVDLEPDAATAAAMQQQLEQFDAQVYQHPEFSDRNNLTGDLLGHAGLDQLHRMDAFQWLNGQLAEHVSAYLRALLGPDHGLMAHIQKAWPVVCARNGGTVDLHSHRNAQLSAVFYVLTDPANESGELEFEAPDDYFSHVMAIPYRDAAVSGGVFA
ncbi:MAG: TIGR02466 family protein, partial [Synechococcus sp.]